MKKLIASLALCGLVTTPAFAATFIGSTGGASIVTDYSDSGLISFDLDLKDTTPVTLSYQLTAADLLSGLDFNAVLRNLTGVGLNQFTFSLGSGSFQSLGTVTRSFDTSYTLSGNGGQKAVISFGSPEYLDVGIGNALGNPGEQDWVINTSGLQAGDVLTLTAAVPEPESYAMALLGLLMLGALSRTRKG